MLNNKDYIDKNIHLYIGFMNDEQKNNFNLKDNNNVHLINLSNHMEDKDINHINDHYSELCVYYYLWKHQIKSEYISIGQHRRYISNINFKRLDNNEIQVFPMLSHLCDITPYEHLIKDGFNSYIIGQFVKYLLQNNLASKDKIYDVLYNKNFNISFFNIIACNWNVFNELCKFIFNFMQELMFNGNYDSYNDIIEWDEDMRLLYKNSEFIINKDYLFTDFSNGRVVTYDRNIAAIFELLIPLYGKICYDVFYENPNKKLGIELLDFDKDKVYNIIFKWISKNTFTGTLDFYVKTPKDKMKFLQNLVNETWYGLSSGNVYIVEEFPKDVIILNYNEYIDVDNPLDELDLNNIKKFDNNI